MADTRLRLTTLLQDVENLLLRVRNRASQQERQVEQLEQQGDLPVLAGKILNARLSNLAHLEDLQARLKRLLADAEAVR
jgi:hypothetical protein